MSESLNFAKLSFKIEARDFISLPYYKGSTFRGGFGNAFKRVVCALKTKECSDCLLKEKCIYSYVFETPPPANTEVMRKYTAAPHPFIIEPPSEKKTGYKPGDEMSFGLVLVGRAIDYLPYFIYTFDELGRIGIGKRRGKYELKEVKSQEPEVNNGGKTIYSSEDKTLRAFEKSIISIPDDTELLTSNTSPKVRHLTLNFLTPLRIKHNEHLINDIKNIEFHILVTNLLRRLFLLNYFHCSGSPSLWSLNDLIEKAKNVKAVKNDLKPYYWERYSARQDTKMNMDGFVGEITFEGDMQSFMPLIKAGEILHVGKGTSFGLGRYEVGE